MNNIVLVGFMGAGKSVVGRQLSNRLQFSFLDTDAAIVRLAEKSISDIFAQDGETVFRAWETRVLEQFVEKRVTRQIISTGGGIVLAKHNWTLMRKLGRVVNLRATLETIFRRVGNAPDRPLLVGSPEDVRQRIKTLLASRQPVYAKSDWTCETDQLSVAEVTEAIAMDYVKNPGRKGLDEKAC